MRNGQNNKRMRGRNNNNNNNNNRKSSNPLTRVYESNGPDIKIRGTASHVAEKYIQLARDSQASGDPVAAENYYQHAEHYFRMIAAAQDQFRQISQQPLNRQEGGDQRDGNFDDDDGGDDFQTPGEPGYGNREPQAQQQAPYQQRDNQNYQNRDQQPQYNREQQQPYPREQQQQPRPQQQQPPQNNNNGGDTQHDAGGLPSFITGGAPLPQGQNFGHEGQGDRYPLHRRRRRHRGPRTDVPGGDGNPPPRPAGE